MHAVQSYVQSLTRIFLMLYPHPQQSQDPLWHFSATCILAYMLIGMLNHSLPGELSPYPL